MSVNDILSLSMFAAFIGLIMTGFPVAWVLGGLSVVFTMVAIILDIDLGFAIGVDWAYTSLTVNRIWDVMKNWVLVALPMFIFMGLMLERSGIAGDLMKNLVRVFGRVRGGLAVTVALIGILLAAATGIIGASVVLLAQPVGTAALGWILLGEAVSPVQILGGCAALAGISLASQPAVTR